MSNQTITSVPGFEAGAIHCGIKRSGKPDLAMLVSRAQEFLGAVRRTVDCAQSRP